MFHKKNLAVLSFVPHSEYVKVFDGSGAQVLTGEGCRKNHTFERFLEIPFQQSQNVTIQVLIENRQSYLKVDYGILKDGLFSGKDHENRPTYLVLYTSRFDLCTEHIWQ